PLYNVSYDFLEVDYPKSVDTKKSTIINNGQFKDIYVEDPYKIMIVSSKKGNFKTIRDTLYSIASKLNLKPVNTYLANSDKMTLDELYPVLLGDGNGHVTYEWLEENPVFSSLPTFLNNLRQFLNDC